MSRQYTKQELEQLKKQVAERKRLNEEARKAKLKEDAAIFYRWPGKVLKIAAIVSFIISFLFLIDNFLTPNYHKETIKSVSDERYDIMTQDGWHIICTYEHVCLSDDCSYDFFIHEKEYLKSKSLGYLEIAKSPIFHINTGFRVGEGDNLTEKRIETHLFAQYFLPIFIMFFSLLWIPMKPEKNAQIIVFGYILMIVLPLLMSFMIKHIYEYRTDLGFYEMSIEDLELDQEIESE